MSDYEDVMEDLDFLTPEERKEAEALAGWSPTLKREPVTLRDLKITDERGNLIPLTLNPIQRQLLSELGIDPDNDNPDISDLQLRRRILKARRQGLSTIILALYFLDTYNNPNKRTVSVAHELDATKGIFEMVTRFYVNLPRHKKIPIKRSNTKELYWEVIDSKIFCATAGTDNVGSGLTLHNVHKSERAKWKGEPKDIAALDASLDEAARLGNIIEETTAYGINFFFQDWQEAVAGKGIYKPHFFAWFINPQYKTRPEEGFKVTLDEAKMQTAFKLSDSQVQWYRNKASERKGLMKQEYPSTPQEAFLSTGKHYFDNELLYNRLLELQSTEYDPITNIVFSPEYAMQLRKAYANDELKVWDTPREGHFYILTADPSMGLTDSGDTDYCSADVVDADTWEQVAQLHGKWEPHLFAPLLAELGTLYNMALVAVLNQGRPGGATVENLINVVQYPKQRGRGLSGVFYFSKAEITGKATPDDRQRLEAGFPENVMTKAWMLDKLSRSIAIEPGFSIYSRKTIEEMMTFIHLPGGGAGADKGAHDDTVSTAACAAALLNLRFERTAQRVTITPKEPSQGYGRESRR